MDNYVPTTVPVNINSLKNDLYVVNLSTVVGDLQPSITRVIRFPPDSNGHTILIQDAGAVNMDGINLKTVVGQYVLIKDETNAYGLAIGVPEPFIPFGGGSTTATPFPPNVPGLPSGFPPRNPGDAPPAPPATPNYDPVTNPTGGVSPYNYYFGHPYRDNDVTDITKSLFGIYQIVELQTPPAVAIDTLVLTRTRESLDIHPGSIVFVKTGNSNQCKQFVLITDDTHFALGFSGKKPNETINNTVTVLLSGTASATSGFTPVTGIGSLFTTETFSTDIISFHDGTTGSFIESGTVNTITNDTLLDLTANATNTFSGALMYVNRVQSVSITAGTTTVSGNFTDFLEMQNLGSLTIGCVVRIPAVGGEEHVVSVIVSNTSLILATPHVAGATDVPMFIVGTSDINYKTVVADVPQPLIITNADIENLDVCNITMDASLWGVPSADFSIVAPGTFSIGAGVTVLGIPIALMNPFFTETYVSNVMQSFQITNWVTGGFDASGAAIAPPGPAGFPTGALGPLQIFSQDATTSVSFRSTVTVGAIPPYFVTGPLNNLIDIANLTMDGTLDLLNTSGTDGITSASGTLLIGVGGIVVDFDSSTATNLDSLTFNGTANPAITTSAGNLGISSATTTVDFNNNDLINIDSATANRINVDNITGATGVTIDFLASTLTNIATATITTLNVTTIQNTTSNILINPLTNVNFNAKNITNIGNISSSTLTVSGNANLPLIVSNVATDINIMPGAGGSVNFTGETLNLTSITFTGYPQIISMGTFDGSVPSVLGGFNISGIADIGVTGQWTITLSGAPGLSNATHSVQVSAGNQAALVSAIIVARIATATTIQVFAFTDAGVALDVDLFYLSVWSL